MNDWVVESPSFEEQLMNNRIVYLNQKGINEVVDLIKNKDKEIERLNNILDKLEQVIKNYKYTNTCHCYSCNKELCDILLDKIKELRGEDNGY